MFENDVFNGLVNRFHENKLSHAFLLETNDINKCRKDIIKFIKYISCSNEFSDKCDNKECNICHLIDNGVLPSLVDVFADGIQIKKGQIQDMMNRFKTKPVYNSFNIYIINECEKLNDQSANALLKFLEEPEDSILGFYITSNKMNVISTIRSRCQEYFVYYDILDKELDKVDDVVLYLNSVYKNDDAILYNKVEAMKYYKERSDWLDFFLDMYLLTNNRIKDKNNNYNIEMFTKEDEFFLIKLESLVESVLKYLQSNGNIELILDKFVIEMRNLYA